MDYISAFYSSQSLYSDPKELVTVFTDLPHDIPALCTTVRSLFVSPQEAVDTYHLQLSDMRKKEKESRYVSEMLKTILYLDKSPLSTPRPPEKRFIGSSRDAALLLCSILRFKHVSARIRSSFVSYLKPDYWENNWLCEYWDKEKNYWQVLDPLHDSPRISTESYLYAGEAWKKCNHGDAIPDQFGISSMRLQGLQYILASVLHDFGALNKVEVLPWDFWGIGDKQIEAVTDAEIDLINTVAEVTLDPSQFLQMRELYQTQDGLRVPPRVHSFTTGSASEWVDIQVPNL